MGDELTEVAESPNKRFVKYERRLGAGAFKTVYQVCLFIYLFIFYFILFFFARFVTASVWQPLCGTAPPSLVDLINQSICRCVTGF